MELILSEAEKNIVINICLDLIQELYTEGLTPEIVDILNPTSIIRAITQPEIYPLDINDAQWLVIHLESCKMEAVSVALSSTWDKPYIDFLTTLINKLNQYIGA